MSFSGRSGAELKYDNGAGSMNLKDQGGASMFFDGAGNATTKANNNKEVNVGNDNTVRAGNTNMINVADASVLQMDKTGKVSLTANTEFKIVVGASTIIIDKEGKITINGKEIKVDAKESLDFSAINSTKIGGKKVEVTGGDEVQFNGKKVNINK